MSVATIRNGKRFDVDAIWPISNVAPGQDAFLEHGCRTGPYVRCGSIAGAGDTVPPRSEGGLTPADGIDLSKAMVYACGPQAMIDAAGAVSDDRDLPRHHYPFDAFVSSASVE